MAASQHSCWLWLHGSFVSRALPHHQRPGAGISHQGAGQLCCNFTYHILLLSDGKHCAVPCHAVCTLQCSEYHAMLLSAVLMLCCAVLCLRCVMLQMWHGCRCKGDVAFNQSIKIIVQKMDCEFVCGAKRLQKYVNTA